MREEYHAEQINGTWAFKRHYGWNSVNANVWLPSSSELVGITGEEHATWGTCLSAMQGMNTSTNHWSDANGNAQFAWFKQFNTASGGEKLWNACNQQVAWIRSPYCRTAIHVWRITNATTFNPTTPTDSLAVHPAVRYRTVFR